MGSDKDDNERPQTSERPLTGKRSSTDERPSTAQRESIGERPSIVQRDSSEDSLPGHSPRTSKSSVTSHSPSIGENPQYTDPPNPDPANNDPPNIDPTKGDCPKRHCPKCGRPINDCPQCGNSKKSQPRELVLCFDGTGNTFRTDGTESNIMKIFRMLDRDKENRFCYYQSGIGMEPKRRDFVGRAFHPGSNLPSHKILDQALANSFDKHVIRGYRFLARRWKPDSKIYMFGFSRGAYTARFLNEMLDFVGLISADNDDLIEFVWKAFTKWKFAKPGSERRMAEECLKVSRDTMCRSVGYVRFLGLFDTVSSVSQFNWDYENSNPIIPNPEIMRHAVSIDERRIKFQPVLFEEVRHITGEKPRNQRVSSWPATTHNWEKKQNEDFEEVYFAGDHSDVGGGHISDRWGVSQIPLMWMVQEAMVAGLTFHKKRLKDLGCDPGDKPGDKPEVKEEYERIMGMAEKAKLHDSLDYDSGKWLDTMFWRGMESFPFKRPKVLADGSVQDTRWHAKGLRRPMPTNARVHMSVIHRLENDPEYKPFSFGLGKKASLMDNGEWKPCTSKSKKWDYRIRRWGQDDDSI